MDTVIRKDKNLKRVATNIFGDIVKEAYITTWISGGSKEAQEAMERLKDEAESVKSDNEIDIGTREVVIVFTNEKVVSISSSEWGSIENFNLNEAVEF